MIKSDEFIVLDDVISPQYQDMIEHWLLSPSSSWNFASDIALSDRIVGELGLQSKPGFAKSFYSIKSGSSSDLYPMILPMVFETFHKANIKFDQVLFSRSFLTMPVPGCGPGDYDHIHVDTPDEHMVCLYYANDSDGGDTVFFDHTVADMLEKYNITDRPIYDQQLLEIIDSQSDKKDFKVIKRVTPKKGRAVIFNGLRYHSAARCQSGHRLIVNTCVR
jgi:hypothetical protein